MKAKRPEKGDSAEGRTYVREGGFRSPDERERRLPLYSVVPVPRGMPTGKAGTLDSRWRQINSIPPEKRRNNPNLQAIYDSLATHEGINYLEFRRDYWIGVLRELKAYRERDRARSADEQNIRELEQRIRKINEYLKYAESKLE